MSNILEERLEIEINKLSEIGADPTGGLTRLLYSEPWLEAQQYVEVRMKDIGLETYYDNIGNLFGRLEGSEKKEETILVGSHIDTVVNGGTLDGQYGVITAYLAVQSLLEKYGTPLRSIEVISMAEEEGSRFPYAFWGSKNLVGEARSADVINIADAKGNKFVDAMKESGFKFKEDEKKKREDIKGFLEIHIEQGNVLEEEELQIGIVDSIVGQRRYTVTLKGLANHAGTTPMSYRKDAIYAFSKIVSQAIEKAEAEGPPLVLTFGRVEAKPNTVNVVPGEVIFSIDCRHTNPNKLKDFTLQLENLINEVSNEMGIEAEIELWMDEEPIPMDPEIVEVIKNKAEKGNYKYKVMHSGAGHDAQIIAPHYPTGLIFVPSIDGISHNPAEATKMNDLIEGVKLFADALYELAY